VFLTVLIVDDSRAMRLVLRRSLRHAGVSLRRAREASNAQEALAKLRVESFDAVLLDWNMPGGGGQALLEALAAEPRLSAPPVVVVSAEDGHEVLAPAREHGVAAFVVKPFEPDDLLHALKLAGVV